MKKIKITLTKTIRLTKIAEIEVTEDAADHLLNYMHPASADLWAQQQVIDAPGEWEKETIETTTNPDISTKIELVS